MGWGGGGDRTGECVEGWERGGGGVDEGRGEEGGEGSGIPDVTMALTCWMQGDNVNAIHHYYNDSVASARFIGPSLRPCVYEGRDATAAREQTTRGKYGHRCWPYQPTWRWRAPFSA